MKKSLIALAVAGSFAAPAFAATSNVDIYGIFGASVDIVDRDQTGVEDEFQVSSTASRIGFKGAEDLGGGLSAIWQIESGVNIDGQGTSTWGTRNTFVGLSSKALGTVKLGRHDTAYKSSTGRLDVFGDTLADYNTVIGSVDGTTAAFDVREPNSITYETPNFSGLSGVVTYGQRNEIGNAGADPQLWSLAASYVNGPLFATLAYEMHDDAASTTTSPDATKVGLGYNFGNTTVGGIYEMIDGDGNDALERDAWYLSLKHQMGNIALKGAYGVADDSDAAGPSDGADFYAVGVDYSLSKRTTVYALYAGVDNDAAGSYTLGSAGTTGAITTTGGNPNGLSLGVKHSF